LIDDLNSVLKAFPNIVAAYIFGSRVSGKTTKTSDYDVAVLFEGDYSLDELLNVTLRLARAFDVDLASVDVVGLNDAPVELAYDIIARGKLVYCTDTELRVDFETRLMKEYMDLKPFLDVYYEHLFSRFLKT